VQLLRDGDEVSQVSEFHNGHSCAARPHWLGTHTGGVISC
jgi:hypothetical protein